MSRNFHHSRQSFPRLRTHVPGTCPGVPAGVKFRVLAALISGSGIWEGRSP